jgi:hypothetical protein
MKKKHAIDIRRFSASPKYTLPSITPYSSMNSENVSLNLPFTAYSNIKTHKKAGCNKFFTLKNSSLQSPNTDFSTSRTNFASPENFSQHNQTFHSDITERIESYELRIKKVFDFEVIQENYYL